MSDINFWRPVYRLFKPDAPLVEPAELRDLYVARNDSPVRRLATSLPMEDEPSKLLLAGHVGGGKTTELRKLAQQFESEYTVIWLEVDTALNTYNIGHAEVVVLIGTRILELANQLSPKLSKELRQDLMSSLKTLTFEGKTLGEGHMELPELLKKIGLTLKAGFSEEVRKTLNIRPDLSKIINQVNAIIQAVETTREQKLLVIVDGLDKWDFERALEIFSSALLTELTCHIIYSIPISLRYSSDFTQPMQKFDKCLDLANLPVFKCNDQVCPTSQPDREGRFTLSLVIEKRLAKLGDVYEKLFQSEALDLLCETSGGVMRDLIRLVRAACEVALEKNVTVIDVAIAQEAMREVRKDYTIRDYHFAELDWVHRRGETTSNVQRKVGGEEIVICNELLHNKMILGYEDPVRGRWFDVNPILLEDLKRWRATNTQK